MDKRKIDEHREETLERARSERGLSKEEEWREM